MKGQTLLDCECWRLLGCDLVICKDSLDLEAVFGEMLGFSLLVVWFFFFFVLFVFNLSLNIITEVSVVDVFPDCAFCVCLNSPTAFCIIKSLVSNEAV